MELEYRFVCFNVVLILLDFTDGVEEVWSQFLESESMVSICFSWMRIELGRARNNFVTCVLLFLRETDFEV